MRSIGVDDRWAWFLGGIGAYYFAELVSARGHEGWGRAKLREDGGSQMGQSDLGGKLRDLARNLWWTWQPNVVNLFRELDPILWRTTDHNPIEFLKKILTEQLERRAAEMALHSRVDYAFR